MNSFLDQIKLESQIYREQSLKIENLIKNLTLDYRKLKTNANEKVFSTPRPQTKINKIEKRSKTQLNLLNTTKNELWITRQKISEESNLNLTKNSSSHHFLIDLPIKNEPKTPRKPISSVAKRIFKKEDL